MTHAQETQPAGIALVPYIRLNIHRARLRNQVSYEVKIYPVLVGKTYKYPPKRHQNDKMCRETSQIDKKRCKYFLTHEMEALVS